MIQEPPFDHRKAAQAINFFARANGGEIGKLRTLKLVYFADRYHLRKYGRPITHDQYWAMRHGPVASGVKDLFELDSASPEERHYAEALFEPGAKEHKVRSIRDVDATVLSESDMEALRFAWERFGRGGGIVEKTHQYPEWKRHESRLTAGLTRAPMSYEDFLADPPDGVEPCHPLSEAERSARIEQLRETAEAASLWR